MKKYVLFIVFLLIQAQLLFAQTLLGIDVSGNANGTITWSQVKVAGKEYAWAKATEGLTFNDARFVTNMTNGSAANVVMGAYHFARPDNNSALDEANHFLAIASAYIGQGYLPPALDLEDSPSGSVLSTVYTGTALTTWVQTWLDRVYAQTGVRPIVYTTSTYAAYLTSSLNTTNYKLWIAKPDGSATTPPTGLGIWSTWLFKQYSWTGTVSGISGTGNVDLDVFNGTVTDFNTLIGMASTVCGNDSPCHAQVLPINVGCVNSNCSTVGASPPSPDIPFSGGATCSTVFQSGRFDDDVWFTITPTNTNTVTITASATSNTSNFDVSLGLYSGSCGALTQVKCGNGVAAGSPEVLTYTPVAGTTYYVRVFSYGIGSTYSGDFSICATQPCLLPTTPTGIIGGGSVCQSSTATVTLNATGQNPSGAGGQWVWYSDSCGGISVGTGASIVVSAAQPMNKTYYLRAENSCGESSCVNANVTVIATPVSSSPTVVPVSICQGDSFVLHANVTGTNYEWTYPSGSGSSTFQNPTVKGGVAGQYCLRYKQNGCWSADSCVSVVINSLPSVTATAFPTSIGMGDSAILTVSGAATYQWSNSIGSSASVVVKPIQTTIYTVTGTQNGCSATAQVTVNVFTPTCPAGATLGYSNPPSATLNSTASAGTTNVAVSNTLCTWTVSCNQPWLSVTPQTVQTGSGSFNWVAQACTTSNTSRQATITITGPQTQTITVTQSCVLPTPCANPPIANAGIDTTYVAGMQLGGNPTASGGIIPYTYLWSPATGLNSTTVSNPQINNLLQSQIYTVIVTDSSGCKDTGTVTITINTSICNDVFNITKVSSKILSVNFVQNATYQWRFNAADIAGQTNRQFTSISDLADGVYTCVIHVGACVYEIDYIVSGIGDIAMSDLSIYPNPSSETFTIHFEMIQPETLSFRVVDMMGQLIKEYTSDYSKGVHSMDIQLGSVAKGIYVLQIREGSNQFNKRIEIL